MENPQTLQQQCLSGGIKANQQQVYMCLRLLQVTGQLLRQLVEKAACTHFVQVEEYNVHAAVAAAEAVLAEHVDQARVIEVDETA